MPDCTRNLSAPTRNRAIREMMPHVFSLAAGDEKNGPDNQETCTSEEQMNKSVGYQDRFNITHFQVLSTAARRIIIALYSIVCQRLGWQVLLLF